MSKQQSPVVFRRVHGRVVPIHVERSDYAKAGGLVGAGVATAAAAGAASGKLLRDAAGHESVSRALVKVARNEKNSGPLFAKQAQRTFRIASRYKLEALRLHKASTIFKRGGAAAGATLIGAGVHQALDKTPLKDNPKTKAGVAAGSGIASAFAIRSAYTFVLSPGGVNRETGAKVSRSVFAALRHAAKRVAVRGLRL